MKFQNLFRNSLCVAHEDGQTQRTLKECRHVCKTTFENGCVTDSFKHDPCTCGWTVSNNLHYLSLFTVHLKTVMVALTRPRHTHTRTHTQLNNDN